MSPNEATQRIVSQLSNHSFTELEVDSITEVIKSAIIESVKKTSDDHVKTAVNCCGSEVDLAHQIRAEINRKKDVVITNLMAMR